MTTGLHIEITFHGPFHIATGQARDGVLATVDRLAPLPATSLKGLMRASARRLLPYRSDLVAEVFGASGRTSPWHWDNVELADPWHVQQRARIGIDPQTGAARTDFLVVGEEIWAESAELWITERLPLDEATRARHTTVLACAAAGVHGLGSDRRRGWGWVDLRPLDPPLDDGMLAALDELVDDSPARSGGGAHA